MSISCPSLRAKRSNPWIAASLTLLAMTLSIGQAQTQENAPAGPPTSADQIKPYRYAPDYCDFEITLPEQPQIVEKCLPGGSCFELESYTMVYGLSTTVDISVSCNPSSEKNYERYTQGVMKAALAGMVEQRNLGSYETKFDQQEQYRSAALTGTGTTGTQDKIYTGQLWVGKNSVFTIQAELVGTAQDQADKSFSDILSSIKFKGVKQLPPKPKAATVPQGSNQ